MAKKLIYPLLRERNLILALLLVLTAVAWAILVWQSATPDNQTMGMAEMGAPLFIAIWVVMMVATMFPAEGPMILTFAQVYASKREHKQPFVPTWVFVSSYLVVWTLFGALAYMGALAADELTKQSMWLMANAARIGGGLIVLAGVFQLSPLKNSCLSKCRAPLSFIFNSWHEGYTGSFRMGFKHGLYCLGCCWALMLILFPLGMMNIAAMAAVTLLIFVEKTVSIGWQIAKIAAVALVIYGIIVIFMPGMLPITI
jgi:predicted metal-binding membrane protein